MANNLGQEYSKFFFKTFKEFRRKDTFYPHFPTLLEMKVM
jgi:hypothetical protein